MIRPPAEAASLLTQLLYVSESLIPPDSQQLERELAAILSTSFINNERAGVTGLLLYTGGYFCQLLEGPDQAVSDVFARVEQDSRHQSVKMILRQPTDWLHLPRFPMGCAGIEREADPLVAEAVNLRGWTEISDAAPTILYALLSRVPSTDLVLTDPHALVEKALKL